jgi:3'-phosphoadenosine 5'-phosphosulfate sulfotransferase (PAPS reductase)/FAD synthetase
MTAPQASRLPPRGLASYHRIVVNISGGKDSQAALDVTWRAARDAGVTSRLVTVYADVGADDVWPGTRELAAEHSGSYGIRHEVVCREVLSDTGDRVPQTLSEYIEQRGRWPDAARRYCTSGMKRDPSRRLFTRLAAEIRADGVTGRVRILNVMGHRAQESARRALMVPFRHDERASNQTVREVDEWLPVLRWQVEEVWARIASVGTRPHPVYAAGMPRLSCMFCVLASRSALIRAAQLNPEGARRRAEMEERMGHRFRADLSMAQIIELARTTPADAAVTGWAT